MEDIHTYIKSRNIPKILETLTNTDFDLYTCDDHGMELTHLACRFGLIDLVKALIDKRVSFNTRTDTGDTPLHIAIQFSHDDIFDLIINLPIFLNVKNDIGNTPLHYACFWSNVHAALKLVSLGCSISERNNQNQSPIDLATLDLAEMLAKEFNQVKTKSILGPRPGKLKNCLKSTMLRRLRIEPYVKLEDFKSEKCYYKTVIDEKWFGKLDDRPVVIRKIPFPKNTIVAKSVLVEELRALNVWNEKTIMPPAGFLFSHTECWIIEPFCQYVSLFDFMRAKKSEMTEDMKLEMAIDICQGMQFVHKQIDLLNRFNLTAKSIMVDHNMEAKLNLSESFFSFQPKKKIVDVQYYSREALIQSHGLFDKVSADIWSFGIILDELFTSLPLKDPVNNMQTGYRIAIFKESPIIEIEYSQISKLVTLCLNSVPTKRPQFANLLPILIKIMDTLVEK